MFLIIPELLDQEGTIDVFFKNPGGRLDGKHFLDIWTFFIPRLGRGENDFTGGDLQVVYADSVHFAACEIQIDAANPSVFVGASIEDHFCRFRFQAFYKGVKEPFSRIGRSCFRPGRKSRT